MECKTCNEEKNKLGKGVIMHDMAVIPCPDCYQGQQKLWFGLDFKTQPGDPMFAVANTLVRGLLSF